VKPVKVLRFIDWGPELKQRFFELDAKELPRPSYPAFDPAPSLALLAEARAIRIATPRSRAGSSARRKASRAPP
jgi:hypothetical protein